MLTNEELGKLVESSTEEEEMEGEPAMWTYRNLPKYVKWHKH